jgi:hypothetical protein
VCPPEDLVLPQDPPVTGIPPGEVRASSGTPIPIVPIAVGAGAIMLIVALAS